MADIAFNHGTRVFESPDLPVLIRTSQSAVVSLLATADTSDGDATFPMHQPVLIKGQAEVGKIAKLAPGSDLRRALDGVFDQESTYVYATRIPKGADTNEQLGHIVGDHVANTGVHALKRIFGLPQFERRHRPRLIALPGFAGTDYLPAHQELVGILAKMRAVAFLDGPNTTDEAAVAWRAQIASDRIMGIDPRVKIFDTTLGGYRDDYASPRFAGVQARLDRSNGFWWSVSNQQINGISGVSRPVSYGDVANYLNENGVSTIIPSDDGGHITWGNRSMWSEAYKMFLSVRRTTDMINEAIEREFRRFNGRPMLAAECKLMLESGNRFMRALRAETAIYNGQMFWDVARNLDGELAQGRITLGVKFLVPPPMEDIRIIQHYELSYFAELRQDVLNETGLSFQAIAA